MNNSENTQNSQENKEPLFKEAKTKNEKKKIISRALHLSLPVFCGYLFLGAAFGIMFAALGFSPLWAAFTSVVVFAGSGQFALTTMIGAGANFATVFLTSFFVNSRHIFYGLTFVDEYKRQGLRGKYMIFSLTDETYSVHCAMKEAREDERVWFYVSLFDHIYWIIGGVVGALLGTLVPFDFEGIEFSMTALFAVILVDRIKSAGREAALTALLGGGCALVLLLILSADNFLLPSMALSLVLVYFKTVADAKKAENTTETAEAAETAETEDPPTDKSEDSDAGREVE